MQVIEVVVGPTPPHLADLSKPTLLLPCRCFMSYFLMFICLPAPGDLLRPPVGESILEGVGHSSLLIT